MCSCFVAWCTSVAKNVLFQVKNVLKNILFFLAIWDSPREVVVQLCLSCNWLWWCDIILIQIVLSSECSQEHSFFVKPIFFFFLLRHMLFQFIFFKMQSRCAIIWYFPFMSYIQSIFLWWDIKNILLLEFIPKSSIVSFCLFALTMTFLTCLVRHRTFFLC